MGRIKKYDSKGSTLNGMRILFLVLEGRFGHMEAAQVLAGYQLGLPNFSGRWCEGTVHGSRPCSRCEWRRCMACGGTWRSQFASAKAVSPGQGDWMALILREAREKSNLRPCETGHFDRFSIDPQSKLFVRWIKCM